LCYLFKVTDELNKVEGGMIEGEKAIHFVLAFFSVVAINQIRPPLQI